ncbi:MAG TPA: discoidin domain-containing protein [Verrucomicrobiae bacterium]
MKAPISPLVTTAMIAAGALLFAGCCCDNRDDGRFNLPARPAMTVPAAPAPVAVTTPAVAEKVALKVVRVDSEETAGEDGKGANAVDADPNTIWHTQWQDASPPCPHEIVIELTPPATINGFTYLPRQDDSDHGTIKDYEFYVSDDGDDFGQPVSKGTFENSKDLKTVTFEARPCRFIKLKALSEVNDEAWTSAAEIGVVAQ